MVLCMLLRWVAISWQSTDRRARKFGAISQVAGQQRADWLTGKGMRGMRRGFFASGHYLFALDAKTGRPIAGFGEGGKTPAGGVVAPAIYRNVIIIPVWNIVKAFDVVTGKPLWNIPLIPRASGGESGKVDKSANCSGGMALDHERGTAYVSTGSPHPNLAGFNHPGDDLYSDCVILIDALTAKVIWYFQAIRHDIWELDIPAPPNLVTVTPAGRKYDAVAQVTKLDNTLLLDRSDEKSLFSFRLRDCLLERGRMSLLYRNQR
jgi:hypothetical protein